MVEQHDIVRLFLDGLEARRDVHGFGDDAIQLGFAERASCGEPVLGIVVNDQHRDLARRDGVVLRRALRRTA